MHQDPNIILAGWIQWCMAVIPVPQDAKAGGSQAKATLSNLVRL